VWRHILPNILSPLIVVATLDLARTIIMESTLSFLGLGIQPPTPSWGGMLSDGREYLLSAWWIATFPGVALMLTALSFNRLGDWARDRTDPHLRRTELQ
jgi:peptide/nickel transport system permease protein